MAAERRKEAAYRKKQDEERSTQEINQLEARVVKLEAMLISTRDFIESHKIAAYFSQRWNPWQSYIDKINKALDKALE